MADVFAIGCDLGGTNARAAAVDERGKVLAVHKHRLMARTPEACADALAVCARQVMSQLGAVDEQCIGVGVGIAGQIDAHTGRVLKAPNLGWRDVDIGVLIAERFGRPVLVANDLSVAALGEAKAGAARGHDDALLVFVGSGIGSGMIIGGRIYGGARGVAGELGHIKVRPGGRLCGCGELGCLESYAGGNGLSDRAAEAIAEGRPTSLQVPEGLRPTASMIDRAADEGDPLSLELRNDAAELIGLATANLVTQLNPAVLILGGGVLLSSPTLRRMVEDVVRAQTSHTALQELLIVDPALGDDAGVIGGAFLARSP